MLKKSDTRKILFIGLSNIGDAVLTLPVLDFLRDRFPKAYIVVMSGPRPKEIFEDKKVINELIVYDKHSPVKDKIDLVMILRRKKFEAVVDLRNTAFPLFIHYKMRTPFTKAPKEILHMKNRHFWKLKKMLKMSRAVIPKRHFLIASKEDEAYVNKLLKSQQNNVVVSAGARSHIKRWSEYGFIDVIKLLKQDLRKNIILVGDEEDKKITLKIVEKSKIDILDLAGRLNLRQLAYLISKSDCVLTNDSAVLHVASYINKPIVALFGPTDWKKYGPWSSKNKVVSRENMDLIEPYEVFKACREILNES